MEVDPFFERWTLGRQPHSRPADLFDEMIEVALVCDWLRWRNPPGAPAWTVELPLGDGVTPGAADIRRWMLTALGAGATAVAFRAAQGGGAPSLDEAARLRAACQRHADLFARTSWAGAEVGILVDPSGGEDWAPGARGWHRLLWEWGVPVDFVAAAAVSPATAARYRLLIWPGLLPAPAGLTQGLRAYRDAGGALLQRPPGEPADERRLLAGYGVRPLHKGRLLVRKRAIAGKRAWFFTNPGAQPLSESIWVGEAEMEDLWGQALDRQGDQVFLSLAGLDVRVLLARDPGGRSIRGPRER